MAKRKNLNNTEEIQKVQLRLTRKQATFTILTSIISIIISILAFGYSAYSDYNNSKEVINISIDEPSKDFETTISIGGMISGSDTNVDISVSFLYHARIINISRNPVTIVSFANIQEKQYHVKREGEDAELSDIDLLRDYYLTEFDTPTKMEPGESSVITFYNTFKIDSATYFELFPNQKKSFRMTKIMMSQFLKSYYLSGHDIFGNHFNPSIEDGKLCGYSSFEKNIFRKDDPFLIFIVTAKGSTFTKKVKWNEGFFLPYLDLVWMK